MQLLHRSVEHAKAWDADAVRDKLCDNTNFNPLNNTTPTTKNGGGGNGESAQWWVSLFQRLQATHMSDRQQWEQDLNKAKHQSKHLKEELRETIEDRIAWLEEKFLEEIHHSAAQNGILPSDGASRASTASTAHDSSDSEREYYARRQQSSRSLNNPRHQFLSSRRSGGANARESAVEVSYDSSMALQRLDELERVVEQQQLEKSELSTVLEHATKVTQQGEQLSASMQQQLQLLLKEVDQTAQKQKKYYREKVATQKRLLQLLEQQHTNTVAEFNHEKDILETTIVQLTADKAALQKQVETLQSDHQQQRDAWEREKLTLQKVIQQFEGDYHHGRLGNSPEGDFIISSTSEEFYPDDVSSIHPSTIRPTGSSSPRHRTKWDENFDRAMVERDYFKQEAEHAKRELESIKSNQTVTSVGSDAGFVKELEKEVQHYKRQLDKELDHYRELAVHAQQELEELKKNPKKELETLQAKLDQAQAERDLQVQQVRDEYKRLLTDQETEMQATITDLSNQLDGMDGEQRYRDSLEKRSGLAAKLRQMERQRDDEKCEWKLRLEAIFSEKKKVIEEKEQLETKIKEMEEKFKAELKELEETIGQESQKWTECSSGAAEQNKRLVREVNKLTAQADAQEEAVQKERKQWEALREKYEQEAKELQVEVQNLKTNAAQEVEQLNIMLVAARLRCDEEIEKSNKLAEEITELRKAFETFKLESAALAEKAASKHDENVKSLKKRHKEETHRLTTELQKSQDESRSLMDKTNELTRNLDSLQSDHRHAQATLESLRKDHRLAKEKWDSEMHRVIEDRSNQILDLRVRNAALIEKIDRESNVDSETVFDAVEELRKDVVSIRETLENASVADNTISSANHIQLSDEIVLIQSSLNDALAEITLGSEAMMEVKEIVDEVCRTVKSRPASSQGGQLQPDVVSEIQQLREQLADIVQSQKDGVHLVNDSVRQGLVTELQNKESQIAALLAQLEQVHLELTSEREKLCSAEKEIVTLNDQADAYGEELMRMQAVNAGLEETLRVTERKMEDAIRHYDEYAGEWGAPPRAQDEEDTSPLLDEALALAQGLTDLVHGRDEDADVMDMLQSLSDLMDQHERGEWPPRQRSDDSPESRDEAPHRPHPRRSEEPVATPSHPAPNRHPQRPPLVSASGSSFRVDGLNKLENPPEPVRSPEMSPPSAGNDYYGPGATTTLQTVVEQLYARCQLLERERTQMMTVTVDLLTSARQANEAELDAALATARRRSAEDILRVRHETSMEKERLFHKLCGRCAKGLVLPHNKNNKPRGSGDAQPPPPTRAVVVGAATVPAPAIAVLDTATPTTTTSVGE